MKFEFHETCILNSISKLTEKYIRQSLFFKKLQDSNCSFIKKEIDTGVYLGILRIFQEQLFYRNTSGWLLLYFPVLGVN